MVTAQDPHQTEMTLEQKSAFIRQKLDELFPQPDIPLHHKDPFTLLVAVVLSAQTTDVQVNRVTTALFARAHTAEGMARLGEDEILRIISPCGLAPQKARAIAALSRILVDKYGGRVPDNFADLEALPGVGHKSASVVMSQAYGKPAFPVDTHIHRLAQRWGLSNGKNVMQTEKDLKALFPPSAWAKLHLQLIYFGRQYCPARGHQPENCPICRHVVIATKEESK